MRVLHVATAFPRSKDDVIVPWLAELVKRQRAAGSEVEVFTSAYRGGGGDAYEGIPVHRFRYFPARWEDLTHDEAATDRMRHSLLYRVLPLFYIAGGIWAIWRLARRRQFDIIHVHWPVPHALFGWVARRVTGRQTYLVTSWYGVELRWVQGSLPLLRGFVRWALRTSDAVVAISSYTAREIARFAQVPVLVIPYGVGFREVQTPDRSAGHGSFRILFVGRLVERKGVTNLIDAMQRLPADLNPILTLIGDGPERAALELKAHANGLKGRVVFSGHVDDSALQEAYAATDVFVLPAVIDARGDTEGLGVVLLEAMSCAVPVVGSGIGGITDIIENEVSGLLVPPADPDKLAGALERLARDPALAARLGAAGERRVRAEFGWPEIMTKWERCYGALIERRTGIASGAGSTATPPQARDR
jgi:glycosyltransferase involved in cell wall biosynthesis